MGLVEVDVYDQNHIPLSGALCKLWLKQPFPIPNSLEDTKTTNSVGQVFLDFHKYACFDFGGPYIYRIDVTYGSQTQTIDNIIANLNCTAPVQTFIFTTVGGCPQGCPLGYVCVGNQCIATGGCSKDSDCATGYHCVNGQCQPNTTGCSSANPCPSGYHCINGQCVRTSGGGEGMWIIAGLALILGIAVIAGAQEGGLF